MPDNWLQNRLSPVKKDTDRWLELARVIETFWQENFDATADRLDGFKSVFTASRADQLAILSELGKYYDIDLPDDNIPLAVIQRRMELFQKDTLVPLTESLKRACPGIYTKWRPLYAISKRPYGDSFYTQKDLERYGWWPNVVTHTLDGSWNIITPNTVLVVSGDQQLYMTSRGKHYVDETNIDEPENLESTIRDRILLTKPLHIVFEGIIWGYGFYIFIDEIGLHETSVIRASRQVGPPFVCDTKITNNPLYFVDGTWTVTNPATALLAVMGNWPVDGTTFLCGANGEYRYPVVSVFLLSFNSEVIVLNAPELDGIRELDGSWEIGTLDSDISSSIKSSAGILAIAAGLNGGLSIDGTWEIGGDLIPVTESFVKAAYETVSTDIVVDASFGSVIAHSVSFVALNAMLDGWLMLDGTWDIASYGVLHQQIKSMVSIVTVYGTGVYPEVFAWYLDGSLDIDGTWELEDETI